MSAAAPHIIRLRGPWQYEPLVRLCLDPDGQAVPGADLPPAGRVTLPADWSRTLGADFRGRVRYVRRFGRPTNLAVDQAVWLVCAGVDQSAQAWLNGRPLGQWQGYHQPVRFLVTADLVERNELIVDVELLPLSYPDEQAVRPDRAGLAGGLIGEVRLEIDPPA